MAGLMGFKQAVIRHYRNSVYVLLAQDLGSLRNQESSTQWSAPHFKIINPFVALSFIINIRTVNGLLQSWSAGVEQKWRPYYRQVITQKQYQIKGYQIQRILYTSIPPPPSYFLCKHHLKVLDQQCKFHGTPDRRQEGQARCIHEFIHKQLCSYAGFEIYN